ncbi:hypothetical protein B0T21DRAFT_375328 [Apiosordaria backusii]|uniref:HNH nuclease domain-containing protein n=1 Tax=Apiosordaria backusii TaxID=314023 RepID=A0AA40AIX3_9PEZI|nr:hypothetical protein B0T21DRAFT_375328 [Apiosordaria backusii]
MASITVPIWDDSLRELRAQLYSFYNSPDTSADEIKFLEVMLDSVIEKDLEGFTIVTDPNEAQKSREAAQNVNTSVGKPMTRRDKKLQELEAKLHKFYVSRHTTKGDKELLNTTLNMDSKVEASEFDYDAELEQARQRHRTIQELLMFVNSDISNLPDSGNNAVKLSAWHYSLLMVVPQECIDELKKDLAKPIEEARRRRHHFRNFGNRSFQIYALSLFFSGKRYVAPISPYWDTTEVSRNKTFAGEARVIQRQPNCMITGLDCVEVAYIFPFRATSSEFHRLQTVRAFRGSTVKWFGVDVDDWVKDFAEDVDKAWNIVFMEPRCRQKWKDRQFALKYMDQKPHPEDSNLTIIRLRFHHLPVRRLRKLVPGRYTHLVDVEGELKFSQLEDTCRGHVAPAACRHPLPVLPTLSQDPKYGTGASLILRSNGRAVLTGHVFEHVVEKSHVHKAVRAWEMRWVMCQLLDMSGLSDYFEEMDEGHNPRAWSEPRGRV